MQCAVVVHVAYDAGTVVAFGVVEHEYHCGGSGAFFKQCGFFAGAGYHVEVDGCCALSVFAGVFELGGVSGSQRVVNEWAACNGFEERDICFFGK